jgi:hypothetical protein
VNKKKQKNFPSIGAPVAGAPMNEVFCALFFKKAPLPYFPL